MQNTCLCKELNQIAEKVGVVFFVWTKSFVQCYCCSIPGCYPAQAVSKFYLRLPVGNVHLITHPAKLTGGGGRPYIIKHCDPKVTSTIFKGDRQRN